MIRLSFKTFVSLIRLRVQRGLKKSTWRAAYTYTPLRTKLNEMRVIKLLPGLANEEIRIEMIHLETDSNAKYEALPYVLESLESTKEATVTQIIIANNLRQPWAWADPPKPQILGWQTTLCALGIGSNLSIAMKPLRKNDEVRILLIDALCIKQGDVVERSKEVGKMTMIYGHT